MAKRENKRKVELDFQKEAERQKRKERAHQKGRRKS